MADNSILIENQKPGTPQSVWDAPQTNQIEGFTTDISVNHGDTVNFKINLNLPAGQTAPYHIEIYRLGYYGGNGATLVTTLSNLKGIAQPNPITDSRGDVDAGNWSISASWATPSTAVSGVYLAKLVRDDEPNATNQIPFIVRDDGSHSDIVLQTDDTTWQAYNGWSGNNGQVGGSLYGGFTQPPGLAPDASSLDYNRAFAVSYNRPIITREDGGQYAGPQDYLFGATYSAVYWLEKNGYSTSYISGVDTDRLGAANLEQHKAYISVGHDEYWSADQRANVEAARDAGVNLLFWSGNEVYWKTRLENSIADGAADRTLVTYKESKFNNDPSATPQQYANVDPSNQWSGLWRDTRFVASVGPDGVTHTAVGAKPENALTGQMMVGDGSGQFGGAINVPAVDAALREWRDTGIGAGGATGIAPGIIGYEWDTSPTDANRPAGLIKLSDTVMNWGDIVTNYGNAEGPGTADHTLTLYRAPSGALVFGSGTVFWSWGLSNQHDQSPYSANIASTPLQQFTTNLFADMGIQPTVTDAFLQSEGLVRASASNDHVAATAVLGALPASVNAGATLTISGTANDVSNNPSNTDGQVALVEVSVDGGQTWNPAQGTTNWTFSWVPPTAGTYTIEARAIDDSLNLPSGAQISTHALTAVLPPPPSGYSLFGAGVTPTGQEFNDNQPVELGMKFSATADGTITALRYYRDTSDASDTDQRAGHLWSSDGSLLGTVSFTSGPGQSGWQVANLSTPVAIHAGQTYVVSYGTNDNYLATANYFSSTVTEPYGELTAPSNAASGGNGVYAYGSAVFPNQTYQSTNYWTDVLFTPTGGSSGGGGGGTNSPPAFTSPANLSMPENSLQAGTLTASDPDHNTVTYAIVGGPDAGLFTLNATTGVLQFKTAPDFEAPKDVGADNTYNLTVSVSDGIAAPVQQALAVAVTDVPDTSTGAGAFTGHSIKADYIFGATADTLFPSTGASQTATVNAAAGAVEFANLPNASASAIGNGQDGLASVDLGAQSVTIQFPLDPSVFSQAFVPFATAQQTPFNGVRLTDADGTLPAIRGFSILSQQGFTDATGAAKPLVASDFTVTSEGIFLNMAGKGRMVDADPTTAGVQPAQVVLAVNLDNAPVPAAETVSTARDTPLQFSSATLLTGATDADGDTLSVGYVKNAVNGTAVFDPQAGVVTFTPASGFVGTASFDYVVNDGFGGVGTATVTVNVTAPSGTDHPPTATPIDAGVTNEDAAPLTINLLSTATDPDGDHLSVQGLVVSSSNAARTVVTTLSAAGVLTLDPAQFNNMAQGALETITASYGVSDGIAAPVHNTATLVMQGVNDPPVAHDDAVTTPESQLVASNVITNPAGQDTDPDGNPLSVVAVNGATFTAGTPVQLASGALVTMSATGDFTYNPNHGFDSLNAGQQATDSFTYGVSDGLATSTATVRITVTGEGVSGQTLTGTSGANSLAGGAGADSISGLAGNDTMAGNDGADTLNGGAGNDRVDGGNGDDLFLIRGTEAQGDTLTGGAGTDTLRVDASGGAVTLNGTGNFTGFELFDGQGQIVQGTSSANRLDFSGFSTVTGVAAIQGLGGADTLIGSGGNDVLDGGTGNDSVSGGAGDDVLIGGAGADTLTGGAGADTFRYAAFSESTSSSRDLITDFQGAGVAGGDIIDVSALTTTPFHFNGTGAFSGGGIPSIRYVIGSGVTDIQLDSGNGGSAEMVIRVNGQMNFGASDFIL